MRSIHLSIEFTSFCGAAALECCDRSQLSRRVHPHQKAVPIADMSAMPVDPRFSPSRAALGLEATQWLVPAPKVQQRRLISGPAFFKLSPMNSWPHAPPHWTHEAGIYFITASTLRRSISSRARSASICSLISFLKTSPLHLGAPMLGRCFPTTIILSFVLLLRVVHFPAFLERSICFPPRR
jgi:hypothetical protein